MQILIRILLKFEDSFTILKFSSIFGYFYHTNLIFSANWLKITINTSNFTQIPPQKISIVGHSSHYISQSYILQLLMHTSTLHLLKLFNFNFEARQTHSKSASNHEDTKKNFIKIFNDGNKEIESFRLVAFIYFLCRSAGF